MDISVVVPLYNEDESLTELEAWVRKVMDENNFSYEIMMVDDGSTDNSWKVVQGLSEINSNVKGIKFRRNYGKSAALHTGFQEVQGDVVITMDADLQDSPDEIPELFRMIKDEKFDLVSGWKKERHDPLSKTIPTKLYNGVTGIMTGIKLHDMNCGLKAYRKEVVKTIEVYGEMHRYIPVIAKWAGFKNIGEKVVVHQARKFGVTKFGGLERFIRGPLDLLSIVFVGKFGKRPMHFFGSLGAIMFTLGFGLFFCLGARKVWNLIYEIPAKNIADISWFYVGLTAMILGTLLFCTGFLAELVSRNSPVRNAYLIETKLGMEENETVVS
ncbi:glycosyltransferase family 2 protein [Saprospiraceae bacterium]|nr:glycosyltransferase family 2 protein [Saprospiraceae bacterium]MDC3209942.1 glycosyltransferase family 2 protein [Saprospiraceae bacterium]MDC3253414.1 glycosyltransferase family 2 protein [bacterium]